MCEKYLFQFSHIVFKLSFSTCLGSFIIQFVFTYFNFFFLSFSTAFIKQTFSNYEWVVFFDVISHKSIRKNKVWPAGRPNFSFEIIWKIEELVSLFAQNIIRGLYYTFTYTNQMVERNKASFWWCIENRSIFAIQRVDTFL